jgi:beta-ribofuranosylaminobenzene 5'-phosphate synthase
VSMPPQAIRVTTGSRLHFGMFSFGDPSVRQFGGVGCMIDKPGVQLRISAANCNEAYGPLAQRALEFAGRMATPIGFERTDWRIDIEHAPRDHVGLGTGTQLGLAVSAGVMAVRGFPAMDSCVLSHLVGRGERSSIGIHGFERGGLLVEAGKRTLGEIGPLVARVELPAEWRFLVIMPRSAAGLSGDAERHAFSRLPPVPSELTAALTREALLELLPAAAEADFAAFSQSLYRFGCLAGSCFAAAQQGTFLDPQTAATVATLRSLGVEGVVQTSWGPSVAALLPSAAAGVQLMGDLQNHRLHDAYELLLAAPLNSGARIEPLPVQS